jgi:membrane associated rhomboid family serine protease
MPPRKDYGAPKFSLPRLSGAALIIVIANVALSFLLVLSSHAQGAAPVFGFLLLLPRAVVHGFIWQLLTYSFLDPSWLSLLFSSFALWSFGGMLESGWGSRRFVSLYFGAVLFAGLASVGLSYTHIFGVTPDMLVFGAWGGIFGLLAAYGTAFANQETMLFPFPAAIKAKWLALIWIGVAVFMLVANRTPLALAELGGAAYGYLWVRAGQRRIGILFSERYYGLRNRYFKWKRRRAARKFEVYMRKHDRSEFFDQYGNYRPPGDKKDNGEAGKGRWVQ